MPKLPTALWKPTTQTIAKTHIGQWMKMLRLRKYSDLHRWSVRNREKFWAQAIQAVGIRFRTRPTQVLDPESKADSPQWLPGASLNIAESCFQAPADSIAIVYRKDSADGPLTQITYGELAALSNRVSNGLWELGIRPGDGIAIDLPMTPEAVAIYLGVVQCGAYVIGIADSFAPQEIAARVRIGSAKLIFTQDVIEREGKSLPLYEKVIEAKAPRAVVLTAGKALSVKLRTGDQPWAQFLSGDSEFTAVECSPDDITNVLFSSGTTGDPKAIPWTHVTPIKCATDAYFYQDIQAGDAIAWPTSLGWMMGPWLIYAALINQGTIALYGGMPHHRGFGEFLRDARVKVLGVVPSLVKAWKNSNCMKGLKWKDLRCFSSTGECSNPVDMAWLMKLGGGTRPVIEYCGGTEIGGAYITSVLALPNIPASFNTPTLGLDVVIKNEKGKTSQNGELFIVPPSIGLSNRLLNKDHFEVYYLDCPPGPRGALLRRHGDQVESLGKGYYRAHGRVDDTMNLGGIKVSSAEIETVLNKVDGILETAAIAVPPAGGGPSQLVIYAVLRSQKAGKSEELLPQLQTAIKSKLNPLFKISDLKLVSTLPRTASNKVMRRVLRAEYLEGRG